MSIDIMNIGFKSNLEPTPLLIYLSLADFANDEGQCFPSKSKIAKKASVSLTTVKYYIKAFESLNILKTEQLYRNNKSKSTLQYTINKYSNNLDRIKVKNAYKKARSGNSPKVTVPKYGHSEASENKLSVTVQNRNCDGLESSYLNHQSLEEEIAIHFEQFYLYLNSIGVKATKSEKMHQNKIRANLIKGHKATLQNYNGYLVSSFNQCKENVS